MMFDADSSFGNSRLTLQCFFLQPEGIMVPVPGIFSLFGHADANPLEFLCYATHPSPNIQHTGGSSGATQTVTLPA
jgi:hypothetical protein